jgi:hypothetical protein
MFNVTMLPAGRGDCLWIEYGEAAAPHLMVVDGGIPGTERELTRRLLARPANRRHIDLIVISHIDIDHIAGVLGLLREPVEGLTIGDIWFNGWPHLPAEDPGELGAKQGEELSFWIEKRRLPWNAAFDGKAVAIGGDDLPIVSLPGEMTITLLSPRPQRLFDLRRVWGKEIEKAGLVPGDAGAVLAGQDEVDEDGGLLGDALDVEDLAGSAFKADTSEANGSSIALLAEHGGRRCLLAGDAFAGDVLRSVSSLAAANGDDLFEIAALKVSHHGGRKNTSAALIKALACRNYLFSTNGTIYGHPQVETVARIVKHGREAGVPRLLFNHRCDETLAWDEPTLHPRAVQYETEYPEPEDGKGLTVRIG